MSDVTWVTERTGVGISMRSVRCVHVIVDVVGGCDLRENDACDPEG